MLAKLLSLIDRRRFACSVISLREENALSSRVRDLKVPLTHLDWPRAFPTPAGLVRLLKAVRAAEPDLIQGWMYHGNLAASFASRFLPRPAPLAWGIRKSMADPSQERFLTGLVVRLGALVSGSPRAILYNSRIARAQHEALGYRADSGQVIPNGFDTSLFKPDPRARSRVREGLGIPLNAPLVGLFARLHPQKDHGTFLKAADIVARALPEARFLLVGTGVTRAALAKPLRASGLAGKTFLPGERRDMPALNAALDVAVSSSSFGEGFPNALGEAMACGVPCVATNVGDSSFILDGTGRVVPPGDPEKLSAAILSLLRLPASRRRALGSAARRRVVDNFSLDSVTQKYESLWLGLLEKGGTSEGI
jgi:glycosyltransferase involved in cell wall biosynthesis